MASFTSIYITVQLLFTKKIFIVMNFKTRSIQIFFSRKKGIIINSCVEFRTLGIINKATYASLGLELCLMTLVIRRLSICFSYCLECTFKIVYIYGNLYMYSFFAIYFLNLLENCRQNKYNQLIDCNVRCRLGWILIKLQSLKTNKPFIKVDWFKVSVLVTPCVQMFYLKRYSLLAVIYFKWCALYLISSLKYIFFLN